MRIDLHNHTPLCNHATGSMREYVQKAIQQGIEVFGFSDHAPMDFDKKYRMDFSQMKQYEQDVLVLQRDFKGTIEIKLGYEVDFLPKHMDKRVLEADVDYLIGSIHFLDTWGFDNPEFLSGYKNRDIDEIYEMYFEQIAKMAQSGYFEIAGHIDLIKVFQYYPKKKTVLEYAKPALAAIKKAGMALELNGAGFRKPCKEAYPSKEILQEAHRLQIPITFGSDAHKPDQVGMYKNELLTLAKEVGYTECVSYTKKKKEFLPL